VQDYLNLSVIFFETALVALKKKCVCVLCGLFYSEDLGLLSSQDNVQSAHVMSTGARSGLLNIQLIGALSLNRRQTKEMKIQVLSFGMFCYS